MHFVCFCSIDVFGSIFVCLIQRLFDIYICQSCHDGLNSEPEDFAIIWVDGFRVVVVQIGRKHVKELITVVPNELLMTQT